MNIPESPVVLTKADGPPPGAISSYAVYLGEKFKGASAESDGKLKVGEAVKILAQDWKELSENEKSVRHSFS